MYIYDNISLKSLRMTNISDKICRENQNTHFIFNKFFPENLAVYEIIWKNMVEEDIPQITYFMFFFTMYSNTIVQYKPTICTFPKLIL